MNGSVTSAKKIFSAFIFGWILSPAFAATIYAGEQLGGSEWRPTKIGTLAIPKDSEMFFRFGGEEKLEGHAGCNKFFGKYKLLGERIQIDILGATQMACANNVMNSESRFLQALGNAWRFSRDGIELLLFNEKDDMILRCIRTDPD